MAGLPKLGVLTRALLHSCHVFCLCDILVTGKKELSLDGQCRLQEQHTCLCLVHDPVHCTELYCSCFAPHWVNSLRQKWKTQGWRLSLFFIGSFGIFINTDLDILQGTLQFCVITVSSVHFYFNRLQNIFFGTSLVVLIVKLFPQHSLPQIRSSARMKGVLFFVTHKNFAWPFLWL